MRLSAELDNIIKTAKFVKNEKAKHCKSFNKDGYDVYLVEFTMNGQQFTVKMFVAVNVDNKTFYDIVNVKKKGISPSQKTDSNQSNKHSLRTEEGNTFHNNSVRNNLEKVNNNSQKK